MILARWCPLPILIVALLSLTRGDEPTVPSRSRSATAVVSDYVGAGSCSATACHGSIAPWGRDLSPVLRNEHTTWMSDDPHSRAYQVLFDSRSERIALALAADPAQPRPAYRDERCLACHATPRPSNELAPTAWLNPDGVGCESCHGPARRWLGPHTTTDWTSLPRTAKADLGMRDSNDLPSRARLCVGCHVGAAESDQASLRDVNHDLIAAGHPRLNFELAAYLDDLPAHWVEKDANATPPGRRNPERAADFTARAWSIGRLTTLAAALELLQSRSRLVDNDANAINHPDAATPWPEFTEYDCFSCHHDLNGQTRRDGGSGGAGIAGSPRWGSWSLSTTDELLAEIAGSPETRRFLGARSRLATEMAKPFPDTKLVGPIASEAATALAAGASSLESRRFDSARVAALIGRLDQPDGWERAAGWDEVAQRYLALTPLLQSWIELDPDHEAEQARLTARLKELRALLTFPKGFDSPKGFQIETIRSVPARGPRPIQHP